MRILIPIALAATLALAGCGGNDSFTDHTPPPTTPTPPVAMVDAFFTAVMAFIGDGSETTTEPKATDAIVATAPEDTEPVALK